MKSAKSITNLAFGTAVGCAFAIPARKLAGSLERQHIGGKVAAVISAIQFFVNLLWPDESAVPHQYQTLTGEDLDAAMAKLTEDIAQIVQDLKLDSITNDVVGLVKTYDQNWSQLLTLKVDKDTSAYDFINDSTQSDFVRALDEYFDLAAGGGHLSTAYAKLNSVTMTAPALTVTSTQRAALQNRIFPVYMLIGSFISSYLKGAVVWRWGNEWRASLAWEKWVADRIANPDADLTRPPKSIPMPSWQDWRQQAGCPINRLVDEINDLLAYCEGRPATADSPVVEGLYAGLSNRWNDRLAKTVARAEQISVKDDYNEWEEFNPRGAPPVYYWVEDSKTGFKSANGTSSAWAKLLQQAMAGSQIAYEWAYWTKQYGLDQVEEDDIKTFGNCIGKWKENRDSVRFSEFPIRAGQHTFESLALWHYPTLAFVADASDRSHIEAAVAALAKRIYDFNNDDPNHPPTVVPGFALKIPEIDTYDAGSVAVSAGSQPPGKAMSLLESIRFTLNRIPNGIHWDAVVPSAASAASGLFLDLLSVRQLRHGPKKMPAAALGEADRIASTEQLLFELAPLVQGSQLSMLVNQCRSQFLQLHENWSVLMDLKIDPVTFDFAQDQETLAAVDQLNHYVGPSQALANAALKLSHHGNDFARIALLCGTLAISALKLATMWRWGNKLRRGLKWNAYQLELQAWSVQPNNPAPKPEPPADAEQCPTWTQWQGKPDCPVRLLVRVASMLASRCKGAPAYQASPMGSDQIVEDQIIDAWQEIAENFNFTIYVARTRIPLLGLVEECYGPAHGGSRADQLQYMRRFGKFFITRLAEVNKPHSIVNAIPQGEVLIIPEIAVSDYPS